MLHRVIRIDRSEKMQFHHALYPVSLNAPPNSHRTLIEYTTHRSRGSAKIHVAFWHLAKTFTYRSHTIHTCGRCVVFDRRRRPTGVHEISFEYKIQNSGPLNKQMYNVSERINKKKKKNIKNKRRTRKHGRFVQHQHCYRTQKLYAQTPTIQYRLTQNRDRIGWMFYGCSPSDTVDCTLGGLTYWLMCVRYSKIISKASTSLMSAIESHDNVLACYVARLLLLLLCAMLFLSTTIKSKATTCTVYADKMGKIRRQPKFSQIFAKMRRKMCVSFSVSLNWLFSWIQFTVQIVDLT